jgi:membrane associated rhomboid family serine protease
MENNKNYTFWLAGICIIVFMLQKIISGFTEMFFLSENALTKPWQFLTAIFLHGGIVHLFYNIFALLLFGFVLEKTIGSRRFLALFILSGVLANFISFFWFPNALGASGAIMAILGVLAVIRPGMTVWAFNLPMPMFIAAIVWAVGSIIGIFGFGDQTTGYLAHLSGLVIGAFYGTFLRIKYPHGKKADTQEPLISEDYIRIWEDNNLR